MNTPRMNEVGFEKTIAAMAKTLFCAECADMPADQQISLAQFVWQAPVETVEQLWSEEVDYLFNESKVPRIPENTNLVRREVTKRAMEYIIDRERALGTIFLPALQ